MEGKWLHCLIDVIQRSMLDMIVNLGIAPNIANARDLTTGRTTAGVETVFHGQSQLSQLSTIPSAYL